MLKKILIFEDENKYITEKNILYKNGYECIFENDENDFIEKVKKENDLNAVMIFHNRENDDCYKYNKIFSEIIKLEKINNISIISVFDSLDSINIENIREIDDFFVKPTNIIEILHRLNRLKDNIAINKRFKDDINEVLLMYEAMSRLVATVIFRTSDGAEEHAEQVQMLTTCIANIYRRKYPNRIIDKDIKILETLVLLHDIGIMYIDKDIVYTDKELTSEEELQLRKHSLIGGRIFRVVRDKIIEKHGRSPYFLDKAIEFAEYHHEKCDGTGYPYGLTKDSIPLYARLIACGEELIMETSSSEKIADVIHNMNEKNNDMFDKEITQLMVENMEEIIDVIKDIESKYGKTGKRYQL